MLVTPRLLAGALLQVVVAHRSCPGLRLAGHQARRPTAWPHAALAVLTMEPRPRCLRSWLTVQALWTASITLHFRKLGRLRARWRPVETEGSGLLVGTWSGWSAKAECVTTRPWCEKSSAYPPGRRRSRDDRVYSLADRHPRGVAQIEAVVGGESALFWPLPAKQPKPMASQDVGLCLPGPPQRVLPVGADRKDHVAGSEPCPEGIRRVP